MTTYLSIHHENNLDQITLETRWTEIAADTRAHWQMTLFNMRVGLRYCEWDAPGEDVVREIFRDLGIKWSEILEVGVTVPADWCLWCMKSGKRTKANVPYFLAAHHEPYVPRQTVESRWAELAEEQRASWLKTWYNLGIGRRYCWWEASNQDTLESVFRDRDITWEKITEVRLTTPAEWTRRED